MKRYSWEGIWMPHKFGGFRIILDGTTWMVCEEYSDLEREYFALSRLVRAGKV